MPDLPMKRLSEILGRLEDVQVLVVGDIMLDRYVWGLVSRISPEAPVPVVDIREETSRMGGAANVANNVVALGAGCRLMGVVGQDSAARSLESEAGGKKIALDGLVHDPKRPTTVKTRVIAHNQQIVRTDLEVKEEIAGETEERLFDSVISGLDRCDAVIISDYGKGVITSGLLENLIPLGRSQGKVVSVDPKETHFMNYRKVSLITPNQYEAGGAVGMRIHDEESLRDVGWKITRELEPDALLITRGADGMSLFQKDGRYSHFPTVAFTLALCAGAAMGEAAHIANHAAGLVIRELGTATVSREALVASFRETGITDVGE
jgi:rfaE bifunctional protein kinase chain/domain